MARRREQQDFYFREAKRLGYVSRAAFKLIEIDDKQHLLAPGLHVLDIGCAPGAWLQVAAQRVKTRGRVVGIDLNPVNIALPDMVRTLQGDVLETPAEDVIGPGERPFDAVLSDAAPTTTGDPTGDHFRSMRLCEGIVSMLPQLLLPGGPVLLKTYEGENYADLLAHMRTMFAKVKGLKPKASRSISREMFVLGLGYEPSGLASE